jgi:hypothetical protein
MIQWKLQSWVSASQKGKGDLIDHPIDQEAVNLLVAEQNSGGEPHIVIVAGAVGVQREPVKLHGSHGDATSRFHIHSATEHHGESAARTRQSAEGSGRMEAARQEMGKRGDGLVMTIRDDRPEGVGVVVETHTILRLIRPTEIGSDAEPVIQISSDGGIPTIGIHAPIEARVLITAKDLRFGRGSRSLLRECRQRE